MCCMQTLSEENYLKVIYHLEVQGLKKITPTAIAEALSNNPASVVDMLRKLSDKQFVAYEKSKGALLTETGRAIATQIVRKHRLWECFLVDKLGYSWDAVHEIAEQLEHVQAPELADRLDNFLGHPQYDPHGDPIPKADGETASAYKMLLSEMGTGKKCRVVGVKDTNSAFLQYLGKLDIGLGTEIKIIERIPFDDSLVILIGNKTQTNVSGRFAENLLVNE